MRADEVMTISNSELLEALITERRVEFEVLDFDESDRDGFVALYDEPESRCVVATLPMHGARVCRRPLGKNHRAGSILLEGLALADALQRVARANLGLGLELHRWS
jgi:hypothetical protein